MSKEKKRIELDEEKMYFYEISATIVILFSLITFSELGFVGRGLKSLIQILFGDFYFVLVLYLILHGIFALVKRRWFDLTSIKFNGFVIFFLSLITLNHIGFYERLGFESSDIFKSSMTTYLNTVKNLIQINSYGGGIVGALFLQILIFLFNTLGTLVILIVLLILSLSFMTNFSYKSTLYYSSILFKKIRTLIIIAYKYFHNIKFPTKTIKKAKLNLNLNLNLLDDCDNKTNEAIAHKLSAEIKKDLDFHFNNKNIIKESSVDVGFSVTRFVYCCVNNYYDKNVVFNITNNQTIIYENNNNNNNNNNNIIVEVGNSVKRLLTIKYLLLNTNEIPLGLEVNNKIITFNPIIMKNILISGSKDTGVKTYIKSFIVANIFKYRYDFKLVIFDYNKEFIELKHFPNLFTPYVNNVNDIYNTLSLIAKELERRIELLNNLGYSNYIDHNEIENQKIEVMYVIVNSIDLMKNDFNKQEAKLLYFIKFGYKVGIHFIIINRSIGVDKELLSNVQTRIIFKCNSTAQSYEMLNNNNGCLLENVGDVFINQLDVTMRCTTPYISNSDYDKITTKFICN